LEKIIEEGRKQEYGRQLREAIDQKHNKDMLSKRGE
jgi:hypothetical protein